MKKLTTSVAVTALAIAFVFVGVAYSGDNPTVDGCGDVGSAPAGTDINVLSASSDGTVITVVMQLCGTIVDGANYRVHFDYKDELATDFPCDCDIHFDDTMKLAVRNGNLKITGPSTVDPPISKDTVTNGPTHDELTFRVSYVDLSLNGSNVDAGDTVLIWADTQKPQGYGIVDRAPDTDDSDGCSKPEDIDEVVDIVLN